MKSFWADKRKLIMDLDAKKQRKSNFDKWKIRLIMSFSKFWGKFIHNLVKNLRDEYKLPWMRVRTILLQEVFQLEGEFSR